MDFFQIRSCKLFALGWLQTTILLISASCVVRIIGMSHQCLAKVILLISEAKSEKTVKLPVLQDSCAGTLNHYASSMPL
jgi:hypothetical protein